MEAPWVLIDLSYLAHRAFYTTGRLSYGDQPTGVIFGLFETLRSICLDKRVQSNRVAIFFDSRQSYRKVLFPDYKRKRHEDKSQEDMLNLLVLHQLVELLRDKILPEIGFPLYRQIGLESDDVIAQTCLQLDDNTKLKRAIIITADADLYQCITNSIHWYDPARDLYLDHLKFWALKELDPKEWRDVKAYAGCHTDNVPGIPGVGEKSAIDYIKGELKPTSKKYAAITSDEGKRIWFRNCQLVTLPHCNTKPVELREPVYNTKAFTKWVEKLGLQSLLGDKRAGEWDRFFSGRLGERQTIRQRTV